jgi:hypothetical protein
MQQRRVGPALPLLLPQLRQRAPPVRLAKALQRLQQLELLRVPRSHREQAPLRLLLLLALLLVPR